LTGGSLPTGAETSRAVVRLNANVSRTDVTFSVGLAPVGGSFTTVASGLKFSGTGTRTQDFTLTLTGGLITAMGSGSINFRITGAGTGTRIFRLTSSTAIQVIVTYTAAGPVGTPTSASLSASVAESSPTLTWSGASAGTMNSIAGYEIGYCDSTNGSSWGGWSALKTVSSSATSGSTTVDLPTTRGNYRKYRIRTIGSLGAGYESTWKETAAVRKNTVPSEPTSIVASPEVFVDEKTTIAWSGASGGTSAIKAYMIAARHSTNGSSWGSWNVITPLNSSTSSGTYQTQLSTPTGTYTQFAILAIDTLDVYSQESVSNTIYHGLPTAAGAPTSCVLIPAVVETSLTLSWAGASPTPGNAIIGYELQLQESAEGTNWGEWLVFAVVDSTATGGSFASINPPATRGIIAAFACVRVVLPVLSITANGRCQIPPAKIQSRHRRRYSPPALRRITTHKSR
jgi:hypothetical protein